MKKSLLAVGLTLAMVLTMATPAFAANLNGDGRVDVTKPGNPGGAQEGGMSFNAATVTSAGGTTWQVADDDDTVAKAADTAADINVFGKVVDSSSKIYKVDLAWGAMKFEYNSGSGQWNTTSHAYDSTGTAAWTTGSVDGVNNKVSITNHSNNAIDANFMYKMGDKMFNANVTSNNAVLGNFFDTSDKALAASKVLTGTYQYGYLVDGAVADELLANKISLPTADGYNSTPGNAAATDATNNQPMDPQGRKGDVFFAFSGTPDADKGKDLETFKKAGVITVIVTTNKTVPLNRPLWTAPAP